MNVDLRTFGDSFSASLRLVAIVLVFASGVSAQSVTMREASPDVLPEALRAAFMAPDAWADSWYLPVAGVDDTIRCHAAFSNRSGAREVTLDWTFRGAGGTPATRLDRHVVSFKPTAVCREAGRSAAMYVAGWDAWTGATILERWEFTDLAVVQAAAIGVGGGVGPVLEGPTIVKQRVLETVSVAPLRAVACHRLANELWLLEDGSPSRLLALDLDTGALGVVVDAPSLPELAEARSLEAAWHRDAGFVLFTTQTPVWGIPPDEGTEDDVIAFQDFDLDGVIDGVEILSRDEARLVYTPGRWNDEYP